MATTTSNTTKSFSDKVKVNGVTFQQVKQEVHRIDRNFKQEDFKIASVLLASLVTGPNQERLVSYTGYDKRFVQQVANRCRTNGIWRGKNVNAEWGSKEDGTLSFIMDLLVVKGLMSRSYQPYRNSKVAA